jgi:hypothetical protein
MLYRLSVVWIDEVSFVLHIRLEIHHCHVDIVATSHLLLHHVCHSYRLFTLFELLVAVGIRKTLALGSCFVGLRGRLHDLLPDVKIWMGIRNWDDDRTCATFII